MNKYFQDVIDAYEINLFQMLSIHVITILQFLYLVIYFLKARSKLYCLVHIINNGISIFLNSILCYKISLNVINSIFLILSASFYIISLFSMLLKIIKENQPVNDRNIYKRQHGV